MGRPTKLNPAVANAICTNLASGASIEASAEAAGITRATVHNWLKRGRAEDAPDEFAQFAADVTEAQAVAEVHLVRIMRQAASDGGPGDWRAAAWLLARRHPERWSEKRQLEVSTAERPSSTQAVAAMFAQVQAHLGVQTEEEGSDDQQG
jgi:transposase